MNRKLTSTFLLVFSCFYFVSNSQSIFFESFQNGMPPGFTLLDVDGKTPNATTAYIGQTWSVIDNFDQAGDSIVASNSWFNPAGCCANDYIITSAINLTSNNTLTWDVKSQDVLYPESYEVRIGSSPTALGLSTVLYSNTAENSTWTTRSVNLQSAGFSNQTVYIGFRNISNDNFLLLLDDIEVSAPQVAGVCGPDTVTYTLQKTSAYDIITINNVTSGIAGAQYFDCPQSITVSGFDFYAYKETTTGGTTINITAALYLAGTDSMPTGAPLASKVVTVDTNFYLGSPPALLKSAVFNSAVTVNAPYVLVITNNSANGIGLLCNDYSALPPDGDGEWLSSVNLSGTWTRGYDITVGGFPFDADWLMYPYCSYNITADFSPNTTTGTAGVPVAWTNNSSPIIGNRMYNFAAYLGQTNDSYTWNYGDGSPTANANNTSHSYGSNGTYTVSLKDTIFGWTSNCYADTTGSVTIGNSPTGFCGVDTVTYTLQKTTAWNVVSLNDSTSGHEGSQYFDCPQSITIYGFDFYAYKQTAIGGISNNVIASIYLAGTDSMPTGPALASTVVNVDTNYYLGASLALLRKSAIFSSPVTVTQPYVLVVTNNSANNVDFVTNDYTAVPADGEGEFLSSINISGTWLRGYDVVIGINTFDADFLFYPHCSYTLQASFNPTSGTGNVNIPTAWTNTSSPIFNNRMYNFLAYLGLKNDSYSWNFGDGSPTTQVGNASHAYSNTGTYTVTLSDTLLGWTTTCFADTTGSITIGTLPAGVCGLDTVLYPTAKATGFNSVSLNNVSSSTAVSQYFDCPQAITVYGFSFVAYKADDTSGITIDLTASIFAAGSDSMPTGPALSTQTVNIDTNFYGGTIALLEKSAIFPSPVTVSTPYVLVIENNSPNDVGLVSNDYTAIPPDGGGEFLNSSNIAGTWLRGYDINVGGNTFDADWIFHPYVTYQVTASFTPTSTTGSPGVGVNWTNTSSPLFGNRMYNQLVFNGSATDPYTWNYGDGSSQKILNGAHTYSTAGTYTVTLSDTIIGWTSTCTKGATGTITISGCQLPVVNYTSSTGGFTALFNDGSTNSPTSWFWDFGDGNSSTLQNPSHTYSSAGTYTVCLTATNACGSDSSCSSVVITCPIPNGNFTSSSSGLTATFTDGSNNSPTSWLWDFGDGNTSTQQNPAHTYGSTGNYTACLTSTNACGSDSTCSTIVITCPFPSVNFTSSVSGLTVSFTDASGNSPTGWLWDFGDGNTSATQNPSHTYTATGTYTVCLTATNSCGTDSSCSSVNLSCPLPSTNFTNTVSGFTATFTDASTNSPTTWLWDFGDGSGSSLQNPVHTYSSSGTFTVCLTATNGCGTDSTCSSVIISCPLPNTSFTQSVTGFTASFTDASSNSPTSWLWAFGDGNNSTQQNPSHTYSGTGTYTVCLTSTNSCGSDSSCSSVVITCAAPSANYTNSSGNLSVTFADVSTGSPTSWSWTFGDGNTSTLQNPSNTYASPGSYTVCLTASNSCSTSTTCKTIVVTCPPPTVGFTNTSGALSVNFADGTSGATATSWAWTFGDGGTSSLQNPSHTYGSPGSYTVCLTVTSVCSTATACSTIVVTCAPPTAAYTSNSTGLSATFTDVSTGNPTAWAWTFGDGGVGSVQNPTHQYASPGTYTVCLIANSTCGDDTICNPINVTCTPAAAAFSSSINGLTVTLTDASNGNPTSWAWDYGDGNSSILQNPVHTFTASGTYNVCLTITDSCGADTSCQQITVNCPPPATSFTFNAVQGVVTFTDASTNSPTTWNWNFGDGNSSTNQSPTHTYLMSGNYSVCLTATNACGSDTSCQTVNVLINAIDPALEASLVLYPNPTSGQLTIEAEFTGSVEFEVSILDASGRLVMEKRKISGSGEIREGFDFSELSVGSYFMHFEAKGEKMIRQFVKQ